jgi:hypothetical protein
MESGDAWCQPLEHTGKHAFLLFSPSPGTEPSGRMLTFDDSELALQKKKKREEEEEEERELWTSSADRYAQSNVADRTEY